MKTDNHPNHPKLDQFDGETYGFGDPLYETPMYEGEILSETPVLR